MDETPHLKDGFHQSRGLPQTVTPRIPFVIAAPTVPGFPVCLRSKGFEDRTRKVDRLLGTGLGTVFWTVGRTVGES